MEHNEWVWLYTKHLSKTPLILTSDVEYLIMFEGNKAHVKLRPPRRLQAHESAESSGTETLLLAAWTKIKIPLAGSLATRRSSLGTECCYRSLGRKVWYGKLIESVTRQCTPSFLLTSMRDLRRLEEHAHLHLPHMFFVCAEFKYQTLQTFMWFQHDIESWIPRVSAQKLYANIMWWRILSVCLHVYI